MERQDDILAANAKDLGMASSLPAALRARLQLSPNKLQGLAEGLQQLSGGVAEGDLVGQLLHRLQVGEGLELVQQRVPIGVLLVIFESRPDCLPQVRDTYYWCCWDRLSLDPIYGNQLWFLQQRSLSFICLHTLISQKSLHDL